MTGDLGLGIVVSMKDAFTQNASRIQNAMMDLDATVAASSEKMSRNMDRIQKGTMMVGAGLSLLAVPTALIASTAATQKALGEMASLGVKDLGAIEDAAESFSNQWAGANKAEFVGATYDVKSALANLSDEAVGVFTGMAALTAKATKATTQEMVGTFTTAYGIFKPMMADMNDMDWAKAFSGAMSQTVAAFKTNGTQMADAIKNIGAVAAASNIPLEEQLAILGQLQTTMPGSEAGTLYKAFIMKAAEAGDSLGLSFVDSMGKLKGVVPILQEIKFKFPDLSKAAAQVELKKAFGSDEAVKFVLQMSAGMESLQGNIESVGKAMKGGTELTTQMADAMNRDIGAQWELVRQQFSNLSEILGKTLLPVISPVMSGISRVILFLQKMAKSMPNVTRVVLTLSMALGAILVVAGSVTAAIGTIGVMLPAIQAGLAALGTVAAGIGAVISTYLLPVIAIAAAVVLAVVILKKAWESNFGGIQDFVMGTWDKIKLAFEGIKALVTSLSGGVGQMSGELAGKLQQAGLLDFVVTVFMVYYRIREFMRGIWEAFSSSFDRIKAILEPVVSSLISAFSELFKAGFSIFQVLGLVSTAADGSAFYSFGSALGSILGIVATVSAYLIRFFITPLILAIRVIAAVNAAVIWVVKTIVSGFLSAAQWISRFVLPVRIVMSYFGMLKDVISIVFGVLKGDVGIAEGFQAIGQAIMTYLMTPFQWARDTATSVWTFLSGLLPSFAGFLTGIANSLLGVFLNLPLVAQVKAAFDGVIAFLNGGILTQLFASGQKLLTTLAEGIKAAAMAPVKAVESGLAKVREFLPFSDAKVGPLSSLTASGQALLGTIAEGMQQAEGAPVQAMEGASSGLMGVLGGLWSSLSGQGASLGGSLLDGAMSGMNGIKGLLGGLGGFLPNPFQGPVTLSQGQAQGGLNPGLPVVSANPLVDAGKSLFSGVMNLAPKLDGGLVPKVLQAALSLSPVLATALPEMQSSIPVAMSQQVAKTPAASIQGAPAVSANGNPQGATPVQATTPMGSFTPVDKPMGGDSKANESASVLALLQQLNTAITALGQRPIDVSVVTQIDGRKVAQAVYKDMQDKKIRNYETLS